MAQKKFSIHFVGIGGIGMSGIAHILLNQGHTVSGCDNNVDQKSILDLKKFGCTIYTGNNQPECRNKSIDILVYSTAIAKDNKEIQWALSCNIRIMHRSEMLAFLMKNKQSFAIAGSHGKTTTSSLLSHIFLQTKKDPTIIIGGHIHSINNNAHYGKSDSIIIEADESDRSFLNLFPTHAIVTNIDLEHLETYKDIADVSQTFSTFLSNVSLNGTIVINGDDTNVQKVINNNNRVFITFGESENVDWKIEKYTLEKNSSTFYLKNKDQLCGPLVSPMPGIHNIFNSTAAFIMAYSYGIEVENIIKALATFSGVDRRFTFKGMYKGAEIFDDYGHHPLEIKHTLESARKRTMGKLTVFFQPHRYTRTAHLWNNFIEVFLKSKIDTLIITDIYAASEQPLKGITSQKFTEALLKKNPHFKVIYLPYQKSFKRAQAYLQKNLHKKDTLLLQGAGKINLIISKLI